MHMYMLWSYFQPQDYSILSETATYHQPTTIGDANGLDTVSPTAVLVAKVQRGDPTVSHNPTL